MQDRFKFRAWDSIAKEYIFDSYALYELFVNDIDNSYQVEQCSGLKDKNGKLIYEGDIVTGFFNNNKVIWNKGSFCVDDGSGVFDELTRSNEESTIIGNIHENPELLEDNK